MIDMQPIQLQQALIEFISAATDLAEHMRADLRRDGYYSNETVLKLSEYKKSAEKIQKLFDILQSNMEQLN